MVAERGSPLKKAADFIRDGKNNQARPILVQILREDPHNAQAWFMLSHALAEPERQRYALEQALRADPYFERAKERLEKLGGSLQAANPFFPDAFQEERLEEKKAEPATSPRPAFLDTASEKQVGRLEKKKASDKPRRKGCVRLFLLVLLVGLLGSLVYFGRDYLGGFLIVPSNPTATQAQGFRTLPPTWTPSATQLP
ncbi:MAG: hypothetical protein ACRDFQ_08665 [Anaerolineales bacterium]